MGPAPGREWPATLDVQALLADGWRPVPFHEFVVKIHSRCDLSCDYCYMYEMADQSWRERPRRMSHEIAEQTALRIGEHARNHKLPSVALILHGGEPLLAGPELISYLVNRTRATAGPEVSVEVAVQTNAVGLNHSYLQLFDQLSVTVGVSLDGNAEAHNRHRRFASGRGSYAAVSTRLQQLITPRFRHLFSGLLCTVDLHNDPIETYEALCAFEPPRIDFLLPHGTWDSPPPHRLPGKAGTPYADWLIAIFDRWYAAPLARVRLFEEIMHLVLGGQSSTEMIGLTPTRLLVIETDGAIEQADTLKVTYQGAGLTGLHVIRDPLDAALLLPGVVARQLQGEALAAECRACHVYRVCGGGMYAHRYRAGTGFANPSVYCPDLMRLIGHIHKTMRNSINARLDRSAH